MRDQLMRGKYRALLGALLVLVFIFPVLRDAPETRPVLRLLFSLVFLSALAVVFPGPRLRAGAALLGVPTLVGLWTGYLLPGAPRVPVAVGFHLLATAFFVFTTGVILWTLHRAKGVSADSVYAAFCGYLLVGLAFGHAYNALELLAPGSFRGEDFARELSDDRRHFLLTYFSLITLTTVGYGDITPGSDAVRGLAAVEAIVGQFYIAVLVAELIGKRVSLAVTGHETGPAPSAPPEHPPGPAPPARPPG